MARVETSSLLLDGCCRDKPSTLKQIRKTETQRNHPCAHVNPPAMPTAKATPTPTHLPPVWIPSRGRPVVCALCLADCASRFVRTNFQFAGFIWTWSERIRTTSTASQHTMGLRISREGGKTVHAFGQGDHRAAKPPTPQPTRHSKNALGTKTWCKRCTTRLTHVHTR